MKDTIFSAATELNRQIISIALGDRQIAIAISSCISFGLLMLLEVLFIAAF